MIITLKMKRLIMIILACILISGCKGTITGLAVPAFIQTELDNYYLVVNKKAGIDTIITVETSALSSFEVTSVENCRLHAAGKDYVPYIKSSTANILEYNTTTSPSLKEMDSVCIIISKAEDKPRNIIRFYAR